MPIRVRDKVELPYWWVQGRIFEHWKHAYVFAKHIAGNGTCDVFYVSSELGKQLAGRIRSNSVVTT